MLESGTMTAFSVNEMAFEIAQKLIEYPEYYGVLVSKSKTSTILIDAGINAVGGFQAGKLLTEISMGGAGTAQLSCKTYGKLTFPAVTVSSDHPLVAVLGSQFAGWKIKQDDFSAICSGPIRALALKPRHIYDEIGYKDSSERAVMILESTSLPPDSFIEKIAAESSISPERLIIAVAPTASIVGLTLIAGKIIEVGMLKLQSLGLNLKTLLFAMGYCLIPPLCKDFEGNMSRANDAIRYGGTICFTIDFDDEDMLKQIVDQAASQASKYYSKPFLQIFQEAGRDLFKIDPDFFSPAEVFITNIKTGHYFKAGEVNPVILAESFKT